MTSTQAVIVSSGTSIREANASNSASCSGVASSGGDQNERSPIASIRSWIALRTDAGIACS